MLKKILAVASPEWRAAFAGGAGGVLPITPATAAEAVTLLAARPRDFAALVLDQAVCGDWLETLLDLTVGDTDQAVPLLVLGNGAAPAGAASLRGPVSSEALRLGLDRAAAILRPIAGRRPETFSDTESIRVRYQPIVRLRDMRPGSFEILARVMAGDGTLLGPETIIRAMTDARTTLSLTASIVTKVLAERAAGIFNQVRLPFAFNLPLDALMDVDLTERLKDRCRTSKIHPAGLRLELTESQPVTDVASTGAVIARLREAGFRVALDDIAPDTPRLDELLGLPFAAVKIDRKLVIGAAEGDAASRDFIVKITAQAAGTGRAVVAEGIEDEATLDLMRTLGATHGQGYLFARPLPARALTPWLTNWRRMG